MPVLPGDVMMATDMDYDSIAKAGSMLGFGRGDRDGRDALHGEVAAAPVVLLLRGIAAASARRAAKAPAGCSAWSHRIEHGEGRNEDLDLLNSLADNIQGRTICALGDAAAMPVRASSSISATSSSTTSTTSTAWSHAIV